MASLVAARVRRRGAVGAVAAAITAGLLAVTPAGADAPPVSADARPGARADLPPEARVDGGPGAGADGGPDAGADGGPDARADGGPGARADGGPDGRPDAGADPADPMVAAMPALVAEQVAAAAAAGAVEDEPASAGAAADEPAPAPVRVTLTGFVWVRGRFTEVAVPQAEGSVPAGGTQLLSGTIANGVNDDGKVVGTYAAGGTGHGFLLDHGRYTTIDVPGASSTSVVDIDNHDRILGQYVDAQGQPHGFVRSRRGRVTTLPPVPGGTGTGPGVHRMNDHGQITGVFVYPDEVGAPVRQGHGFLLDDGEFTTFDAPGAGPLTDPVGIDDPGRIVGAYDDPDVHTHGFVRSRRGRIRTLDVPGATFTSPLGINDRGDIVLQYGTSGDTDTAERAHGALLRHGRARDRVTIDLPGAEFSAPSDISNHGRVAGFAYDID